MAHDADKTERMGRAAEKLIAVGCESKALDLAREYGTSVWVADCDGGEAVEYPHATKRREAAEAYVEGGEWGDPCEDTVWITTSTWQRFTLGGCRVDDHASSCAVKVSIEPIEPECAEGQEHDWQDHGHDRCHGAGIVGSVRCRYCGAVRITDTYAQDPEDGEQGMTSTRYDLDAHDTSGPAGEEARPSSCDVRLDDAVAQYVSTYPSDGPLGEGASTMFVIVSSAGEGWRKRWYVHAIDEDRICDDADDTAYETEDEAISAAEELASEKDEGDGNEDAEDYLRRKLVEAAGDQDPCGAWGISTDGECPEERYATQEQADAACALADAAMADRYPGTQRLIHYSVIHRVAKKWVGVADDEEV